VTGAFRCRGGPGRGRAYVEQFKSAQPGARAALAEIWNAEDREHAEAAARSFVAEYGTKWPKAVAKITDDQEALLAFFDYPVEHWLHLRSTDESFKAGVALSAGWDGVSLLGGRGRPRSEEQGCGAGSPAAQLAP
jgi:hypothetical protein